MAGGDTAAKKSDLGVRTASALVMLVVAGTALWLGGWWWKLLVLAVGIGVWLEWSALVRGFTEPGGKRIVWRLAGVLYCGIACAVLVAMRDMPDGMMVVLLIVGAVIGTDIGAYFAGRAIGGPKIAPKISPSKTWAGLGGGMFGAAAVMTGHGYWDFQRAVGQMEDWQMGMMIDQLPRPDWPMLVLVGAVIAIIAQSGDFFESWMKRRAGVKDSGNLIPGHGGLFDRVDGLLAVCFVLGVLFMVSRLLGGA